MKYLPLVWRNLIRRKTRTAFTLLSIVVAFLLFGILAALNMALMTRKLKSVIHHSDQGSQYTSIAFGNRCKEMGVRPSMATVGDAYDHAMRETSHAHAPWYVVPADSKPYRDLLVAELLVHTLQGMSLVMPRPKLDLADFKMR